MGRRVKLVDKEGEYGDNATAFKAPNGRYYSSEEAYQNIQKNEDYRQKCISKMFEILGYESYQKMPSIFYKHLNEWKGYGFDVVFETILRVEPNINWALNTKDYQTESIKIMYFDRIIENNLNDVKKEFDMKKKINHRLDQDVYDVVDLELSNKQQKTKDISKFLEDDDE